MSPVQVSSAFVGRAAELTRLEEAAIDPRTGATLISGEAGLGKTRLVSEFVARLDPDTAVLTGRCTSLGLNGIPFAPFLPIMRALRPAGPPVLSAGEVLNDLDRLSRDHAVVLVIEDLHWADESSLDLLSFLTANLTYSGVLLVATHRPAVEGRLRGMLAELRRLPSVISIELHPLTRHDVERQLAALLGREPEPGFAGRVYERSEGYPLFVEALSRSSSETPADLRELLLAWLTGLTGDERAVLRAAAVAEAPVAHRLLAKVTGLPEQRLEVAIAALAAARLLVVREAEYDFRHVLFRQAVYEDLLPAVRVRLHARLAEVLLAGRGLLPPETYPAELARHAALAADWPTAITASWQAAEVTEKAGARPEQIRHLERIRELWDRAPDAAAELPLSRLGLLERLGEACAHRGAVDPGLAAVDEALAMAGGDSPYQAAPYQAGPYQVARLLLLRARLRNQTGGGQDDLRRALALLPAEPETAGPAPAGPAPAELAAAELDPLTSALRSQLLVELAYAQMFSGDPGAAAVSATTALDAVGRAGEHADAALTARAHAVLGLAAADSDAAAAMAHFVTARSVGPDPGTRLSVAIWESAVLVAAGQYQAAIEVIQQGLRTAHESFQFVEKAPVLIVKWVQALTALGRWPRALDLIEETLTGQVPPLSHAVLLLCHAKIKLAQGELDAARASARAAGPLLGQPDGAGWAGQYRLELAAVEAGLAAVEAGLASQDAGPGGWDQALGLLADAIRGADPGAQHHEMWAILALAARLDAHRSDQGPDLRAVAATLRCTTRPDDACRQAVAAALTGQAAEWEQAAQAWHNLSQPFDQAQALLSAARAHIGAGDRARARTALRAAITIAHELGARPLAEAAARTARRAGLGVTAQDTAEGPAETGNRFGLTARELDVLRLIAAGLSNRQIGAELFISGNTAGVHVSRILAKLGAATRTQAAAVAREHDLVA